MTTEANRRLMTATFKAWRDGAEPLPDTWANAIVWRLEGHSVASKEYASKQEYVEEFVEPFGARFQPSDRFRPTHIRAVHADGDTVIVLWQGYMREENHSTGHSTAPGFQGIERRASSTTGT